MTELKLEQQLMLANLSNVIDRTDITELRLLCKALYAEFYIQKNHYVGLMQHHWFKPEGLESKGFRERLAIIKPTVDNICSALLDGNLPDGWNRQDAQEFLAFSDGLDNVLRNLEKLEQETSC